MSIEAKTTRSRRTRAVLIAAVHDRLASDGNFTAAEIASDAGCTPGTFWAHFENKDDAVSAAFSVALDDLVELTRGIFGDGPSGLQACEADRAREAWSQATIDSLIDYFATRELLFRLAISRLPESRSIRHVFRDAENQTIELAAAAIGGPCPLDDAAAVIALCQGINNPIALRSKLGGRRRERLALALAAMLP